MIPFWEYTVCTLVYADWSALGAVAHSVTAGYNRDLYSVTESSLVKSLNGLAGNSSGRATPLNLHPPNAMYVV